MPSFNAKEFLTNTGSTPEALASAFGMPTCILNLAANVLALLPDSVLQAIRTDALLGKMAAENDIAAFVAWIRDRLGVFYPFDENGRLKFLSKFSLFGIEIFSLVTKVLAYISALRDFAANMYANYQALRREIEEAQRCLDSYRNSLNSKVGSITEEELNAEDLDAQLSFIDGAVAFTRQADDLIRRIDAELQARIDDPSRRPQFTPTEGVDLLSFASEAEIVKAFTPREEDEIFRLSYGPPKAKFGKFVLTSDGLYYDSQTPQVSGLSVAFTEISRKKREFDQVSSLFWKFDHDPNIGGRGKGVSLGDVKNYINTILDLNKIDDSVDLQVYYDSDNYLEQLTSHKNKRIYDLSSHIAKLESDPEAGEAIVFNTRQSLLSELAAFSNKIRKRKKQIELAIRLGSKKYEVGKVPINDFSYLEGTNYLVDIQKQKQLTLDQDDVNGIILPVDAVYVVPPKDTVTQSIDQFLLSIVGEGNILASAKSVDEIVATVLKAETEVVREGLLGIYNFLETNVEEASSFKYLLDNCISNNNELNAKLVSYNLSSVFPKGLGIPYLNGVVKFNNFGNEQGFNNHVILPPRKEYEDLFYSKKGVSFDFWIHVPNLTPVNQGSTQQLYKIILANENFGVQVLDTENKDINYLRPDFSNNVVKGLLMGFTRDRRITQGLPASTGDENNLGSNTCFFVATTQSLNGSSIGFINKSTTIPNAENDCISVTESMCFKVPVYNLLNEDSLDCLSSIQEKFCHLAVTFDPPNNSINLYFNGSLVATSSLNLSFPVSVNKTLNIPTFIVNKSNNKQDNSMSYTSNYFGNSSKLTSGLPFVTSRRAEDAYYQFTPWVLGGGYTDGYPNNGFLGLQYGGVKSSLEGFIGSFKIYNKVLTSSEVINNYKAQSKFFSNIDLN